jgi:hypothetical protein
MKPLTLRGQVGVGKCKGFHRAGFVLSFPLKHLVFEIETAYIVPLSFPLIPFTPLISINTYI